LGSNGHKSNEFHFAGFTSSQVASVRVVTRVDGGLTGAMTAAGAGIVLLIRDAFALQCVAPRANGWHDTSVSASAVVVGCALEMKRT
tara:strand:+ start:84 stop:344 length:261 start_codon:yes stop_codon:yes gene_type:complete